MSWKELLAVILVVGIVALIATFAYIDEQKDSEAEKICMEQVKNIEFNGWTPDCNL